MPPEDGVHRAIHALIEANPDLDPEHLSAAYRSGAEGEPDEWPSPYHAYERRADEIVQAYLQHHGVEGLGDADLDHLPGEGSDRSMNVLIEKTGMNTVEIQDETAPAVVLPWPVLHEILSDYVFLAHVWSSQHGETAQDFFVRKMNERLADNAAAWAWAEAHPDDPDVRMWVERHRHDNPPGWRSNSNGT